VAAAYCLEMLRKDSMLAVWCETQDDILLEKTVNGQRSAELIQVKSDALDQLWSIVKLCERETRKKIEVVGSSIVEKQLAKDRGDATSHFRLVTLRDINAELSMMFLPFSKSWPGNSLLLPGLYSEMRSATGICGCQSRYLQPKNSGSRFIKPF
jgi:hypothetical protein